MSKSSYPVPSLRYKHGHLSFQYLIVVLITETSPPCCIMLRKVKILESLFTWFCWWITDYIFCNFLLIQTSTVSPSHLPLVAVLWWHGCKLAFILRLLQLFYTFPVVEFVKNVFILFHKQFSQLHVLIDGSRQWGFPRCYGGNVKNWKFSETDGEKEEDA